MQNMFISNNLNSKAAKLKKKYTTCDLKTENMTKKYILFFLFLLKNNFGSVSQKGKSQILLIQKGSKGTNLQ